MVLFIRLYPVVAVCIIIIFFDLARTLRRKGRIEWLFTAFLVFIALLTLTLWFVYGGYHNAGQWAKDWASLSFSQYTPIV
jgi:ATP/ADP translocase